MVSTLRDTLHTQSIFLSYKFLFCCTWIVKFGGIIEKILSKIVQELAIKKRHQAYRIAAIVHIARLKPKS